MNKKKWIAYGVTGAIGLAVIAGGAAAAASSMDLRTSDGDVVPGGAITGKDGNVLDRDSVKLKVTDTSATVVSNLSTPSATDSAVSVASAPAVSAPSAPAPAPQVDSIDSPASAWSAPEAVSPASVASAGSN